MIRAGLLVWPIALLACGELPERPEPHETYYVGARGDWTLDEAVEIEAACDAWRSFTEGALDVELVHDNRAEAWIVRGAVHDENYATLQPFAKEIRIDAGRMTRDGWTTRDVGALVRNMLGQAAGMPLHDGPGVLSRDDVRREFTEADRVACRAAGWCS